MEIKNVNINKIKFTKNSRDIVNVSELMESIKSVGLLEPVGLVKENGDFNIIYGNRRVLAVKKLGYTEIKALIYPAKMTIQERDMLNLIENMQRENLSIMEQAIALYKIKTKHNLTPSEIAARLSMTTSKVNNLLKMYKVPEKYRSKITAFIAGSGASKKGKISISSATKILNIQRDIGLTTEQTNQCFEQARQDNVSTETITSLGRLLNQGIKFDKAIKKIGTMKSCRTDFSMQTKDYETIRKIYPKMNFTDITILILTGRLKTKYKIVGSKDIKVL